MAERREGEGRKEVEISFGTLFRVKPEIKPDRIDVVIDTGEENWLGVAPIHQEENGTKWFRAINAGTKYIGDIEEIVSQLPEEEVIAACLKGFEMDGIKLTPKQTKQMVNVLKESAQKGPRKVRIKS